MNRREEYDALLLELDKTPPEMSCAVQRALIRKKAARNKRRLFGIPAGSLAACFLAFMLLVNLFPPFAAACGNIPLLRELAKAVAWSPSLSAAVENEYVQPIEESQTQDGFTAAIRYAIVDRKSVSFFYTLDFDKSLSGRVDVDYDFGDVHGWAGSAGGYDLESGELQEIDINFVDQDVPDSLDLTLKVYTRPRAEDMAVPEKQTGLFSEPVHEAPDYLTEFTFHLIFDPYFTAQGETIAVDTAFSLDGQTLTLTEVELYPTHLRINLEDAPENTAWLKSLDLYLENERGERFESSINGISATGDPDGEGYAAFWLDSPFFDRGEHLTLHITGARWRGKDAPRVRVDLANGTAEHLPEGFRFLRAERLTEGWMVYFAAPREADGAMHGLFSRGFWDEAGNHYDIWQYGSTFGVRDPETGESAEEETMFTEDFPLAGFDGDVIELEPHYDRTVKFDPPVEILIK